MFGGNMHEEFMLAFKILGILGAIIFGCFFIKIFRQNQRIKADTIECEIELHQLKAKYRQSGSHLLIQPFVPDYLGFVFTRLRDAKTDAFVADVYTREGFNISKNIETENPKWVILSPSGGKTEVKINNMYDAIIIFELLGVNVSIEDYVSEKIGNV